MNDIYSIGLGSLSVFQKAMDITSNNMANVNTPLYSRREVNFTESRYGSGVNLANVKRIYSAATSSNLKTATSNFSNSDSNLNGLRVLEPLLDNDITSPAKYINESIKSLLQLNADPGSMQERSIFLTQLTMMSNQLQSVNSQIITQEQTINAQLQSDTADVNAIMGNIAHINGLIQDAPSNTDINPLLDKREQLVQDLAEFMDFTIETDSHQLLSISLNNGIQVVNGNRSENFNLINDPSYPNNLDMALNNGATEVPLTGFVNSGKISGLLDLRQTLMQTGQDLGRLSVAIAGSLNTQNSLGMDYNGNLGGNIFNDINNATAMSNRVINNTNNTGTGNITVKVNDLSALTTSDYQLKFTTGNYSLTRIADGVQVSSGSVGTLPQSINVDGVSINLNSGTFAAGDQFVISPTRGAIDNMNVAIKDPKLLALAFPVAASATTGAGSDGQIQITAMTDTSNATFATPKQLTPPIKIVFLSPSSYQIQNATTSSVIEGPITYTPPNGSVFPTPGGYDPGYRVTLTGNTMQTGDTFNIQYNSDGMSDNRNGLASAKLYSQGQLDAGTNNFIQAYNLLSGAVSQQTSSIQTQYDSNKILKEQATNQFNEVSAVDTQEESINLMKFQQSYQASAEILQTAKSVFDDVLHMLRT